MLLGILIVLVARVTGPSVLPGTHHILPRKGKLDVFQREREREGEMEWQRERDGLDGGGGSGERDVWMDGERERERDCHWTRLKKGGQV